MGAGVGGSTVDGEGERIGHVDGVCRRHFGVLDQHDFAGGVHDGNVRSIVIDGDAGGCCDLWCRRRCKARIGVFDHRADRAGWKVGERDGLAVGDGLVVKHKR